MLPKSKWPNYPKELVSGVSKLLLSGKVNYFNGKHGKLFEKEFCKKFKIKYSCAISNGTIGLELALLALNIQKGDQVLVTTRSYISSASSILRVGAKPIFVDIESQTMNISPEKIKQHITNKTKALICVHLYGMPCNMNEIIKIAKKNKLKVIEDCSQAHGSEINSKKVGSFGDIGVWSFCNDKIISTGGEGGMIATSNKKIYQNIWSLKDIGKNINKLKKEKLRVKFPYIHDFIGTNARMTEIQSFIGRYQLKHLEYYLKIRNKNALQITHAINNFKSVIVPSPKPKIKHAYYRYVIILNENKLKNFYNRDKIIKLLHKENIACNVGGCPSIYKEKLFKDKTLVSKKNIKNTEYLEKNTISFWIDHTIKKENLNLMTNKIVKILKIVSLE